MKNRLNFLNIVVFLGVLIISLSAVYFFVIYPPIKSKNTERLNKERVINIDKCIKSVNELMYEELDNWCYAHDQKTECSPTDEIMSELNTKANNQINRCYVKYPVID